MGHKSQKTSVITSDISLFPGKWNPLSLFPHFCITVPVAVNLPSSLLHFFGINEQQLIPQPELAMLFVKSWTPHGTTLLPV
jgi:hypothetical protein